MPLAEYQQAALWEALSRDETGLYRYSTILWSDLKKSAKTTLAAAVAAYICFTKESAKIRFVGNDLKQADSRVFSALKDAVNLNPQWKESIGLVGHKTIFPNGSIIESVAVDPMGEAGGNDDMIEYTELWGANSAAHKKLWTETTLSPTKFGQSFRWIDTYAGYTGESETLENLYNQIVKPEYKLDLSYTDTAGIFHDLSDLEVYGNPAARLFCLWNTKPRLAWQTAQYYAQEQTTLLFDEFRRIHQNEWISSESAFITEAEWDACYVPGLYVAQNESIFLSLDAGISDDNFALTGASTRGNTVQAHLAHLWEPPPNGKIDFGEVEEELRRLRKVYRVVQIAYDPYQLHDMVTRLTKEFGEIFVEFSQGAERMIADRQLYNLIRERRLQHNGDVQLKSHILNANAKLTGEYDKLRLVKRTQKLKIDLAVSLSMSAWLALLHGNPSLGSLVTGSRVTISQASTQLPPRIGIPQPIAPSSQGQGSYVSIPRKVRQIG